MGAAQRFGLWLRATREARGLSQGQLAERSGLSQKAISAFERGQRFPRASTLDALGDALEVVLVVTARPATEVRERPRAAYAHAPRPPALDELDRLLSTQPDRVVRAALHIIQVIVRDLSTPCTEHSVP